MRVVQHIHHLIKAIRRIGVLHISSLSRSAVTEIPCYIIKGPTRLRVKIDSMIGAEIISFRDFQIIHIVHQDCVGHDRLKTIGFEKHARIHEIVCNITNTHFDMILRHRNHLKTDTHRHRKAIVLDCCSSRIVDIILLIVMVIHRINGDHLIGARNQCHIGVQIVPTFRIKATHKKAEHIIILFANILWIFLRSKHIIECDDAVPWDKIKFQNRHTIN